MDSDPVSILKPQYLTLEGNGKLEVVTAAAYPCNGFSAADLAQVQAAARQVYVTVSAGERATKMLFNRAAKQTAALATLESFVTSNGINGVDLDFEPTDWTAAMWSSYMSFVGDLVTALGPAGDGVEVDLDGFTTTPWDAERYADVAANRRAPDCHGLRR